MIVTKIEYQKRDPNRVNVFVDEQFFCGISLDTLARENLYEGMDIDDELMERIFQTDLRNRFLVRATEYLSHSPKTEFQLLRYLKNLRFKKKDIWFKEGINLDWDNFFNDILCKLKEYKYIDDENYARLFVQSRLRSKPRSKSVLIGELMSKGVSKEIAQSIVDEEVIDEIDLLKAAFEKKYRGKKFDIKDQKMVTFLQRKGFSWDLIEQYSRDES